MTTPADILTAAASRAARDGRHGVARRLADHASVAKAHPGQAIDVGRRALELCDLNVPTLTGRSTTSVNGKPLTMNVATPGDVEAVFREFDAWARRPK